MSHKMPWMDHWVLGLDEAGRGAALGPMVIAGVVLDPAKVGCLTQLGVRDSKLIRGGRARARRRRRELACHIKRVAERVVVRRLDAATVDRRYVEGGNLNVLERRAASEILSEVGNVGRIVADGHTLFKRLCDQYSNLEAVDHGESHHVAVAAASVIAKDCRDARLDSILDSITKCHLPDYGEVKGGGYGNVYTERFLRAYHERTGELPPETRLSWNWKVIRELRD